LTLALAIACKVTPVLFVPYFAWKRAWKTLAGCLIGLILFFGVVPSLVLGPRHNAELLKTWADQMVKPFVIEGVVFYSEHNNQSVPGLVLRLATHSPSFSTYVGDQYTPTAYHNLLSLDAAWARRLIKACMGCFALLILWCCRTPTRPRQGWRLSAEMGLVLLGMLLFSERTWKHHCVTLIVPFAVICYYLATCHPGGKLRIFLIGSLVGVELLMTSTSTFKVWPRWDEIAKLAQVYGAYVWACLLLVAVLAVLLRQKETPASPSP
jgi:hypothetical protein